MGLDLWWSLGNLWRNVKRVSCIPIVASGNCMANIPRIAIRIARFSCARKKNGFKKLRELRSTPTLKNGNPYRNPWAWRQQTPRKIVSCKMKCLKTLCFSLPSFTNAWKTQQLSPAEVAPPTTRMPEDSHERLIWAPSRTLQTRPLISEQPSHTCKKN